MDNELLGRRKELMGIVKSNKMNKTCVVVVERKVRHMKYEKVMMKRKSYYVHDEKNSANIGDKVRIMETRPLSKLKRWRLLEIVEKAKA
jgi:small subunit ribosomal protein S17